MDHDLSIGQVLYTLDGEAVTVVDVISKKGGQGVVYRVRWNEREYALKWYKWWAVKDYVVGGSQYKNIEKLTKKSAPSLDFVWPQKIVTTNGRADNGAPFGYVMELFPDGYYEMKCFLLETGKRNATDFKNMHARVTAALDIVADLRLLHLQGMSYKDLNANNFIIHPATGAVKIVDNDNVAADGPGGGEILVRGTSGYMAPEIVRSQYRMVPNINSDLYSLAVTLFRLFYIDNPMDGKAWIPDEEEYYGLHPLYCMHPTDTSNRPEGDIGFNTSVRWNRFPSTLHKNFERTFVEGIEHPGSRTTTHDWMKSLFAMRDQLAYYYNSKEMKVDRTRECFVDFNDPQKIPAGCLRLKVGVNQVVLYPGQSLYKNVITSNYGQYREEVGRVGVSPDGRMALQNRSNENWIIENKREGKRFELPPRRAVALRPGFEIYFGQAVGVVENPLRGKNR